MKSQRGYSVHVSNQVGCESTALEGQRVSRYLTLNGHRLVERPEDAEFIVVNTCAFLKGHRTRLEQRLAAFGALPNRPELIVIGCVREIAPALLETVGTRLTCGHYDLDRLDPIFARHLAFHETQRFAVGSIEGKVTIVACRGCTGACTFCSIKRSTGSVRSRPPDEIVGDIRTAVAEGFSDFVLTGDDLGSYGVDIGRDLPALLEAVAAECAGARIVLGNINPEAAHRFLPALHRFLSGPRAHRWLFLPIQSADDDVLRAMGRRYTAAQCACCIENLAQIPEMKFYYDLIVGFPTETENAFARTMNFLLQYPPSDAMLAAFSPEPGTPAARLEPLPREVVKQRHATALNTLAAAQHILRMKDPELVRRFGS